MAPPKILLTNFSKGELSPRIEGRPDLAAYFEGGSLIENFQIMRQGGLNKRVGLRFIKEVKDSSKDTILLPFEASVDDAFIVEMGSGYARFYKNKARLESGTPIEVATPYGENHLRQIHYTQSVDVLFMFHSLVRQHRLSRVSDTNWVVNPIIYKPPPSFEKDTEIGGGIITLTPAAISGTNIVFTASADVFLAGDINRLIIHGAARGIINTVTDAAHVIVDILDPFSSTSAIPGGEWFLRLSPQATLDVSKREPEGGQVIATAGIESFRIEDIGKFITIYGGLIEITEFISALIVHGIIRSILAGTEDADPAAAPAGSWTLEVESWSSINGFPRTGEFIQGRLGQASTEQQRTTFWLSKPDDFDSYAIGATAGDALEYPMASKRLNRIEWMADRSDLYLGTSGSEHRATSGKSDEPFGGDIVPLVRGFGNEGSAPIQPIVIGNRIIFVDRSRKKIFAASFDIAQDSPDAIEVTGAAEHITKSKIRLGALTVAVRPDPIIYFIREDGQLVALTFYEKEKVIGFTRLVTDGLFESVAVKPGPGNDEVWVIVRRLVNGTWKRYVEVFETEHELGFSREWQSMQLDSSIYYKGAETNILSGLSHLEGRVIGVVANGGYLGTFTVTSGIVTLPEKYTEIEGGLLYTARASTMRPAIQNVVIEGLERSWATLSVRLLDTMGGHVNGKPIQYSIPERSSLYRGDKKVTDDGGWSTDGRVTVEQREPFPMTLLAVFGSLQVGGE